MPLRFRGHSHQAHVQSKLTRVHMPRVTTAGHLFLLLAGARIGTAGGWLVVLCIIGAISFVLWILGFRRARAVADTPTSRIASAPQGYVELHGVARQHPGMAINAPLTSGPCVWYRYMVEEKHGKNWRVVESGLSEETFILDDGSGQVVVDPDHAEVMTDHYRCWTAGRMRYTQWLLAPEDRLYAIGEFGTVGGANTHLDAGADLKALLAEWKRNQPDLKKRFDLDGSGQISAQEWELAVRAARREVSRRHQEIRSQPGVNILRATSQGQPFLLSNFEPGRLERRYGWWTRIQLLIAVVAGAAALWLAARMALV